jgi:hypothetical protein
VTGEVLADLFQNFATQIECVLINACYSEVQAEAIVQHIDYVIGMNAPIHDKPAIEFAVGFYDGLVGYDSQQDQLPPVEFAFKLGCNAIGLAGLSGNDPRNAVRLNPGVSADAIPVLKKNPNIIDKRIDSPVVEPRINIKISGRTKILICQRLTQDWQDLADYFDIKLHERAGFRPGREPHSIWEWLEQRNRLGELESALIDIGREDLAEELKKKLVDDLETETSCLGKLIGDVPNLPPHFLPRPEQLEPLKQQVLSGTNQPLGITAKSSGIGLQGMGGIGKTVLATALARDKEVRLVFPDGVIWITFGQTPQILGWQSFVAHALGDSQAAFTDINLGKARLKELFAEKACLLILDDIWNLEHAKPFHVVGERCQILVTTRNAEIITDLGAVRHEVSILTEGQALSLLAQSAQQPLEALPATAKEVARECGYLPLALAMVGAMVQGKPLNRWDNLLHKLRSADLEKIRQDFPEYPYPDLFKAMQVSVEDLEADIKERYFDFAVFSEDTPLPEVVLQTFWEPLGLDEYDTQDVIDELVEKSLAQRDENGYLRLHDLQFDYVRKQIPPISLTKGSTTDSTPLLRWSPQAGGSALSALHIRLLNAYQQKYADGWHTLTNDGYIFQQLAHHLFAAGRTTELENLLFDFRWLQVKLEHININALITDYDFLPDNKNLQLVQGALRLSAHILAEDKSLLPEQLLGRLLCFETSEIQALLEQAQQNKTTWLRPLTASLTPPGGPLLHTLVGHSDWVRAVAFSPDGKYAISASRDKTLKVWNWQTGQEVRTLEGHSDWVRAVAFSPDGKYAISASFDFTLKVWNWQTGEVIVSFTGDSPIICCAVAPDGVSIVAGETSGRVHFLRLEGFVG